MKDRLSFAAILSATTLLTACAGHSGNSLQPSSKVSGAEHSSTSISAPLGLNKRPGHSGSKPLFDPDSAFYADLPDCQSGPFYLKDLMVDEIRVSNQDLSTVSKSIGCSSFKTTLCFTAYYLNLSHKGDFLTVAYETPNSH